jgi:peptide/nickel transport system permease protein
MTEAAIGPAPLFEPVYVERGERRKLFFRMVRRNPLYIFGLTVVVVYLGYSLIVGLDPKILGYNPVLVNLTATFRPPSWKYPFGTDSVGRSIFLAVLYGAPIDAGVSIAIIVFSFTLGVVSGSLAGYLGGAIDEVIMRITDIFLAFPGLILAVAIAAALGPGLTNAMIALMVVWWPIYTRIARGEALTTKQQQYVLAARASGMGGVRISLRHIIPNVINPLIAYATADFGNVIILFSVLGYLGLGAQAPRFDLGGLVYNGQGYIQVAPWYPIFPGIVIFIIVVSFAFVGDLISDFLNPRARR